MRGSPSSDAGVDARDATRAAPDASGRDGASDGGAGPSGGQGSNDGDVVDVGEAAPAAPPPAPGQLAIEEILVDPAGNDLGREWVEVANLAGHALDLGGLHLSDGTTDVAVEGGSLGGGGLLVLGQSADPTKNGGAPVQVAYGTRLQLNNGGDMLAVCLGPCAGGVVLDAFAWDASLGAAYAGHAIVIDRDRTRICPATEPFGTGGSFGSPGEPNPPCPDPDAGASDASGADGGAPAGDGGDGL